MAKDAGALCGVALDDEVVTGVPAVADLDAVLATGPECVVYCAMGDTRLPDAMADVMRILAAGINVVGSSPGLLQYPWGVMPDKYIARVENAARQGNSSNFISGVDPGFVNDLIPLALAGTCRRVEQVRCMEIHDYAGYDGAEVMHYMGFGRPLDEIPMLLQPCVLSIAWGTAIRQLAAGLGIEVDEIAESYQREPAPEDFDIAVVRVAKSTLAVLQFEIRGMVGGHPAIVIEHITRLRPDLRSDLPQPASGDGSYRVEITGEPSYAVDIVPSSRKGDHNHGGARGMGAEHARLLAAEGAKVVIGDILDDEGKALAETIGDAARYVHLDVTQPDQWDAAVATATGEFGKLNVLVNNAGIVALGQLKNFDLGKWQKVIDVNLTGTFLGMRVAVEPMTAAGGGSIINVSSIEGLRGAPAVHPYVASKWAVRGLAKSAALELAPHNIRVNSVHPGFIRTPMTANLPEDLVTIPLGRPGEMREVSTFVLFLASDESSYATGAEFVMDGGLVADVPHKEF